LLQYNENGCRVIIGVHEKRIIDINKELDFLRRERELARADMTVFFAFTEIINKLEFDIASAKQKIEEMKAHLQNS